MSKKSDSPRNRRRKVAGLLIALGSGMALAAEASETPCYEASSMELNTTLRGYGNGEPKPVRYQVDVPRRGVLSFHVSAPLEEPVTPRLKLSSGACQESRAFKAIFEAPTWLLLEVHEAGTHIVEVAAEDPARSLREYKLRVDYQELNVPAPLRTYTNGSASDSSTTNKTTGEEIDEWVGEDFPQNTGATQGSDGAVRFDVCTTGDRDDHGDTFLCASSLVLGTRISGRIDNEWGDDQDVFTFVLSTQETVLIQATGETDLFGGLYDGAGQRLAADGTLGSDGGLRMAKTLRPGRYYVRIEGGDGSEGAYRLTASVFHHKR